MDRVRDSINVGIDGFSRLKAINAFPRRYDGTRMLTEEVRKISKPLMRSRVRDIYINN
jgi:hypothetical protein